jgi:GxxExxY protein
MQTDLLERDLCYSIVSAFFEVYNYFGCGLSESIYAGALEIAQVDRGHRVAREVAIEVMFKGRHVGWQRLDMIVDDRVIVENKATEKFAAFAQQQILSYLRVSPLQVGLILHFGSEAQWHRFVDTNKKPSVLIRENSPHSPHSRSKCWSRPDDRGAIKPTGLARPASR